MGFKETLKNSLLGAIIGPVWAYYSNNIGIPGWIIFLSWSSFFFVMSPTSDLLETGLTLITGHIMGVIFGFLIVSLSPSLSTIVGPGLASPILISAAIIIASQLGRIPFFGMIPAYFIGTCAFFASGKPVSITSFVIVTVGLIFGAITGMIQIYLNSKLNPPAPAQTEDKEVLKRRYLPDQNSKDEGGSSASFKNIA